MHWLLERAAVSFLLVSVLLTMVWAGKRSWIAIHSGREPGRSRSGSGRVTLLYFSSVGCAPCAFQEEEIRKVRAEMEGAGRPLVVRKVDALAEPEMSRSMGVLTLPTTVVLDSNGKISAWNPGLTAWRTIMGQLERSSTTTVGLEEEATGGASTNAPLAG